MNDDTISRKMAIENYQVCCRRTSCAECPLHIKVTNSLTDCELELFLHNLPSAERHGRWEMKEDPYGFFDTIPVCSACGCTPKYRVTSAYCPSCGAKMEGEQNG